MSILNAARLVIHVGVRAILDQGGILVPGKLGLLLHLLLP